MMLTKKFPLHLTILLAQLFIINASYSQYLWKFEKPEKTALTDVNSGVQLQLNSNWKQPEIVTGFNGTGLRTDGYSTWLTAPGIINLDILKTVS